jgi:hypothetical protein
VFPGVINGSAVVVILLAQFFFEPTVDAQLGIVLDGHAFEVYFLTRYSFIISPKATLAQ